LDKAARDVQIRDALAGDADDAMINQVVAIEDAKDELNDPATESETLTEDSPEFTEADLEEMKEATNPKSKSKSKSTAPVREVKVGSRVKVKFVKLRDVLPPCPQRGMFDVERIRDSAYFFS